ncbi:hypothetical protein CLU83_3016 [Flavobacterium sp. 1]|uniref:hypothetical protein n=1 Tax=Flavobacterium sp. 1 TaxID=2035200 RepID=UPI000C23E26D|nr:hypothetical protein [Flavobacterium sp. 1]PJJ09650.1 hypothetical protein CLU83_3016 [Flavobacterium sp. 1]
MKNIILLLSLHLGLTAFAQTNPLIVPANVVLPKDTLIANHLLKSLNGFLSQKERLNKENVFVLKEDLLETSILLDEMKGIEKSVKFKDDNFYKGYLTNIVQIDKSNFIIQLSYLGINENTPILNASFEILAKYIDDKFYFLSPLQRNTFSWQTKKIGNTTFHFKKELNTKVATEYVKDVALFDKKLNAPQDNIVWYGCNDMPELLKNIGVLYKSEYNGRSVSTFNANENKTTLLVNGTYNTSFNSFDPHDLWHERTRNAIPKNTINKPVDEGCAYLYGGSWGISWPQILKIFKEKVASNPKSDWLSLYDGFYNFGESKEKHLIVSYLINALIVEKIEKEKGFPAVIELLSCGKYEKGNDNYFKVLEKLTGINKVNFNDRVWALIKKSGK